jgi:peroxiredoxin Q/BCP
MKGRDQGQKTNRRRRMTMKLCIALLLGLFVGGLAMSAGDSGKAPETGDAAPPFSLVGSDGKTYDLAEFAGKKAVVVAWFPKAFTGG